MKEWGKGNEYDGLITAVLMSVAALVVGVILAGCAPTWPDIGGGVTVQQITIRECREGECS
jgi:hypothetical protein